MHTRVCCCLSKLPVGQAHQSSKGEKLGANERTQAAASQARLDSDVMCFEMQLLKPSLGAADVPGCASQRKLVKTNIPAEAGVPSSLHTGNALNAFPFSKGQCYFGAADWKWMLQSCPITNISNSLTIFHLSSSWLFVV